MPDHYPNRSMGRNRNTQTNTSHIQNQYFLGIGIDRYAHFPILKNAVKDIEDIIEMLQRQYDLNQSTITTLFNDAATRENIIKAFDQLIRQVGPDDKLIIYFSGHGLLNRQNERGFWIPVDAQKGNTAQYLRNNTILEYIEDIKSRHTLLIVDSCFSGSLLNTRSATVDYAMEEYERYKSRWIICSGRSDEVVSDGKPGANSPFAESILQVLERNKDPKLNVAKFADKVAHLTRNKQRQMPSSGPLRYAGHDDGQYIFIRKQTTLPQELAEVKQKKQEPIVHATIETQLSTTPAPMETEQPTPLKVDPIFPDLIFVKGGSFEMGDGRSGRLKHTVRLDDFYIAKYPVTFPEYDLFCEATGKTQVASFIEDRVDLPAHKVSWYDAIEYCNWLSEQAGLVPYYTINKRQKDQRNQNKDKDDPLKWNVKRLKDVNGYRLLTEAEWEYAARGGQASQGYKYAGSNKLKEVGWYSINSDNTYQKVGLKQPNELGLYDMSGNLTELCWDWFNLDFYKNAMGAVNPTGPKMGSRRVGRGGSLLDIYWDCKVYVRTCYNPADKLGHVGFRLAKG